MCLSRLIIKILSSRTDIALTGTASCSNPMNLSTMPTQSRTLTTEQENACVALSDLFLDIEVTPQWADALSSSIRATKVDLKILEDIIRIDLFPILYLNFIYPSEWVGFERQWLIEKVNFNRSSKKTWTQILVQAILSTTWPLVQRTMLPTWVRVREKLEIDMNDDGPIHPTQPVDAKNC